MIICNSLTSTWNSRNSIIFYRVLFVWILKQKERASMNLYMEFLEILNSLKHLTFILQRIWFFPPRTGSESDHWWSEMNACNCFDYLVERCSAIVTWWWKPCFSQLNLGTCILLNCGCSWIQCPVPTMLQDLWELKMLTSPYIEHLKFFLLDNQQQTTTYIEALQNFRYTNALMHYYSNNLQVLNIARIYLVGLRFSVAVGVAHALDYLESFRSKKGTTSGSTTEMFSRVKICQQTLTWRNER